ncbi:MAG: glycoside hydrolase family 3 N-terminal domain-containing protein [Bdellovibrionota bacterium]
MKKHLSHKAGQFLMVGLSSTELTAQEADFLRQVQPKGIIYFRRNVANPNQLIDLTRQVQSCLAHTAIIGIDQEGGRVARLSDPFTVFPGNESLAEDYMRTGDPQWIIKKLSGWPVSSKPSVSIAILRPWPMCKPIRITRSC